MGAGQPERALTLTFVDPEALHIKYESVAKLSRAGAVDLLILFADAFDVSRNVEEYYLDNVDSPLDRFLGHDSGWRSGWKALGDRSGAKTRDFFLAVYQDQLKRLGYTSFGEERISGPLGPLYRLIYASKSKTGLDFWEKAKSKARDGQNRMLF